MDSPQTPVLPMSIRIGTRAAILLAVGGVTIFLLWYFSRSNDLAWVGVFFVYIAVPINIVLLLWVGISFFRHFEENRRSKDLKRAYLSTAAVLVLNYPLALLCFLGANRLMSQAQLTIDNQSGVALNRIVVIDPTGKSIEVGSLENGNSLVTAFDPDGEGPVKLKVESEELSEEGVAIEYVTGGLSSSASVIIKPGLQILKNESAK